MGIRGGIFRNTLANANRAYDWKICADITWHLIHIARHMHADDTLPGLEVHDTVNAPDCPTIDLRLSLFPWARFRRTKGAVKLHALLDLLGNNPASIHNSGGNLRDVNILHMLLPEAGTLYVMDGPISTSNASISLAASSFWEQNRIPGSSASPPGPWHAAPASFAIRSCGQAVSTVRPISRISRAASSYATRSAARH